MFKSFTLIKFHLKPNSTHYESILRQLILTRPPSKIPRGQWGQSRRQKHSLSPSHEMSRLKPSPLRNKTHHFCFHLQYNKVNTNLKINDAERSKWLLLNQKLSTQVEDWRRDKTPVSMKVMIKDVMGSRRRKFQMTVGHWGKLLSNTYDGSTQQGTEWFKNLSLGNELLLLLICKQGSLYHCFLWKS